MYEKGNIYWYKSKSRIYCFAVLEVIKQKDYLIAISDEMKALKGNPTFEEAKESNVYTLAWFDKLTLLSPLRIHLIGQESIISDYLNRAGLWIDTQRYINRNPGSKGIWKHEHKNYSIPEIKLKDTFDTRYIPKTVIY